jgi:hypothetical protein
MSTSIQSAAIEDKEREVIDREKRNELYKQGHFLHSSYPYIMAEKSDDIEEVGLTFFSKIMFII